MIRISHLHHSELQLPLIRELVHRGMVGFGDPELDPRSEEILTAHDDEGLPKAFVIIAFPTRPSDPPMPQIVHFHSEGSRSLTRELVQGTLDFVKKRGYNRLRAVNGSGAPDEVWMRAFRNDGWEIKPVATVFDFEVK